MNIFGRIKIGKLIKLACAPAHLHIFILQRNIWSYYNQWMKGVKLVWRCTQDLWFEGTTSKRSAACAVLGSLLLKSNSLHIILYFEESLCITVTYYLEIKVTSNILD